MRYDKGDHFRFLPLAYHREETSRRFPEDAVGRITGDEIAGATS
jgi:hypothetical protein